LRLMIYSPKGLMIYSSASWWYTTLRLMIYKKRGIWGM
jgi:hypothetical protein